MTDFNSNNTIYISCFKGLAPYLARELESAGYPVLRDFPTGIETEGSLVDCMKLNLNLRTALNVMYRVGHFPCNNAETLYKKVRNIAWERLISPDGYFTVTSSVDHPTVNNSMFPNLKVKDAIVDRISDKTGRRPDTGPERNGVVVFVRWAGSRALIYLNTSGIKIADRSYRRIPHHAPLREPLAAGIVMESGYDGSTPLVCPMCGSGTLAIEAALIGLGRSPGALRAGFGFMQLNGFSENLWKKVREESVSRARKKLDYPIIATDIDREAIDAARKNACTAGVDHLIDFSVCDFAETPLPKGPGILLVNPEYGMRLGEVEKLAEDYKRLGDFFKQRCAGYNCFIFTGNPELAKKVGLKASRRTEFWNAKIECRLLKYEIYEGSKKRKD